MAAVTCCPSGCLRCFTAIRSGSGKVASLVIPRSRATGSRVPTKEVWCSGSLQHPLQEGWSNPPSPEGLSRGGTSCTHFLLHGQTGPRKSQTAVSEPAPGRGALAATISQGGLPRGGGRGPEGPAVGRADRMQVSGRHGARGWETRMHTCRSSRATMDCGS